MINKSLLRKLYVQGVVYINIYVDTELPVLQTGSGSISSFVYIQNPDLELD